MRRTLHVVWISGKIKWEAVTRQWSEFPSGAFTWSEYFSGSLVKKRSNVFAKCEETSGIRVDSLTSWVRLWLVAKCSAIMPSGSVLLECVSHDLLSTLKSPKIITWIDVINLGREVFKHLSVVAVIGRPVNRTNTRWDWMRIFNHIMSKSEDSSCCSRLAEIVLRTYAQTPPFGLNFWWHSTPGQASKMIRMQQWY